MDKQGYKDQVGKLIEENSQLKEKIKKLETEMYFLARNFRIVEEREPKNGRRE